MSEPQSDALTTSPQPPSNDRNGSGQSRTADTWSFNPLLYQLSYWTIMAVPTGIEPAISCVTGRRVNRYTTRPKQIAGGGFEPPTFGLWARRATELLHPAVMWNTEEEGFEPPRAVKPLSVFKTDPFSRTWVFLHNKSAKIKFKWRRRRDSNPRGPLSPCRFSRPIPSAGLGYSSKLYGPCRIRTCDRTVMSR